MVKLETCQVRAGLPLARAGMADAEARPRVESRATGRKVKKCMVIRRRYSYDRGVEYECVCSSSMKKDSLSGENFP